jgi:hypothetical protein
MPSRAPRGHSHAIRESKKKKIGRFWDNHDDKERNELLL